MSKPDFSFESKLWSDFKVVAGADEVGRGCLAGPVVAGFTAFEKSVRVDGIRIDDSKKLTARQREIAEVWIKENCLLWGIGESSVSEINRFGIKKATEIAFRRAIKGFKIDYLLIDAFYIPFVRGLRRKNQKAIIKGDSISFTIAAASIIAKVYRDRKMQGISKGRGLDVYGWDKNKGYGTKVHTDAIKKYGPSRHHRTKFIRGFVFSQA